MGFIQISVHRTSTGLSGLVATFYCESLSKIDLDLYKTKCGALKKHGAYIRGNGLNSMVFTLVWFSVGSHDLQQRP